MSAVPGPPDPSDPSDPSNPGYPGPVDPGYPSVPGHPVRARWVVVLGLSLVLGYGLTIAAGRLWPETPALEIGLAITVSIIGFMAATVILSRRIGNRVFTAGSMLAVPFLLLLVGSGNVSAASELARVGVEQTAVVTDVQQEVASTRSNAYLTTYRFADESGASLPGTLEYRGDADAYELAVGDRVEVLLDPSGRLPMALADSAGSGLYLGMVIAGAIGLVLFWAIAEWMASRRRNQLRRR